MKDNFKKFMVQWKKEMELSVQKYADFHLLNS